MMPLWGIILTVVAAIALTAVITALYIHEKDRKKLEYMLDAFEDGEYNFRFTEDSKFNKALNRIKWIVERRRQQNEQESWTKLIRVLTHEIMNTVSPIASLSDALSHYIDVPEERREIDVKAGLETISSSSKDLIKFVESYRELAGVAKPIKKGLMVDDLARKVIDLTHEQCTEAGAKHVSITASIDSSERTIIKVANDGAPITPEAQEQIFIPFFTTKRDGSGIGLSLSRQIMRAHNGMLDLTRSDEECTEFTMIFK